ncbi:MAG: GNAT family N-acetyltransferase [Candidatus Aenigmatarchaeota archaeon]
MSDFKIREYTESDLDQILKFKEQSAKISFPEQKIKTEKFKKILEKKLEKHEDCIKILEVKSKVAGYIQMSIKKTIVGDYGIIDNVFVKGEYRRAGIGKKMMEEAEKYFKKKKIDKMRVKVTLTNIASLNLCKKLGFEEKRLILEKKI